MSLGGQLVLSFLNGFQSFVSGGAIFTLLTADFPLTGAFSDVANGARLATIDGLGSFVVHYGAGSAYGANNLVLTSAIPEPSSFALLLGGAGVLGLFRRRSRHAENRLGGMAACSRMSNTQAGGVAHLSPCMVAAEWTSSVA